MLSHSAAKGLLPLKLQDGTISSSDGQVTVLKRLGRGVSAASDLPACLSALQQQDTPPAWAVSASHGIFLDLSSSSPSSGAVLDVGEVSHSGGGAPHSDGCTCPDHHGLE